MLLLAAVAIPNFVPARLTISGKPSSFEVRVIAPEGGGPIQDAQVQINSETAITDADGFCNIVQFFQAKARVGHSGECALGGTLRVSAQDFPVWEKELTSLFGKSYDYFNQGTQITYVVTLAK
jgi:hypothetical protein